MKTHADYHLQHYVVDISELWKYSFKGFFATLTFSQGRMNCSAITIVSSVVSWLQTLKNNELVL